jgi:large subunit ribosomal protein L29
MIFRLRFQMSTGQAEALKRLREAKKDLARVKTLLRAQELIASPREHKSSVAARSLKASGVRGAQEKSAANESRKVAQSRKTGKTQ